MSQTKCECCCTQHCICDYKPAAHEAHPPLCFRHNRPNCCLPDNLKSPAAERGDVPPPDLPPNRMTFLEFLREHQGGLLNALKRTQQLHQVLVAHSAWESHEVTSDGMTAYPVNQLANIYNALAESTIEASDEELCEEMKAEGLDPQAETSRTIERLKAATPTPAQPTARLLVTIPRSLHEKLYAFLNRRMEKDRWSKEQNELMQWLEDCADSNRLRADNLCPVCFGTGKEFDRKSEYSGECFCVKPAKEHAYCYAASLTAPVSVPPCEHPVAAEWVDDNGVVICGKCGAYMPIATKSRYAKPFDTRVETPPPAPGFSLGRHSQSRSRYATR